MKIKKLIKNFIIFLSGAIFCYIAIFAYTIYQIKNNRALISFGPGSPAVEEMSKGDLEIWNKVIELIKKKDINNLNDILNISEKDIALTTKAVSAAYNSGDYPLVEITIENISDRNIIIYEPEITKYTETSYEYEGFLQNDYGIDSSVSGSRWCKVLAPKEKIFLNKSIPVKKIGSHKINFSFCPMTNYKISDDGQMTNSGTVIARDECLFKIID